MLTFDRADWDDVIDEPGSVLAPYLMGTGVVTTQAGGDTRPIGPPHTHPDAMLAWCYRGTMTVHLRDSLWRLLPGQGVWIPAGTAHTAQHDIDSVACYTYVPERALQAPVTGVDRVLVPRAVQEMLLHLGMYDMPDALRIRLQGALIEMLQAPGQLGSGEWGEVPVPGDERVRTIVRAVLDDPGDRRSAAELAAMAGQHERTVSRVFQHDIGMAFGRWRTEVRMVLAARLIVDGVPVGVVAQRCGYETTSAFSAAFRARRGSSPRAFAQRVREERARDAYWRSGDAPA